MSFRRPVSQSRELQVSVVSSDAEFTACATFWNELAERSRTPSVFLTHEWFTAAWAWRQLDSALYLLVARRGEQIIGLLPLIRGRSNATSRTLQLLTVPDTQSCDLLSGNEDAALVSEAFSSFLAQQRDWDVMDLGYLAADASCIQTLAAALRQRRLGISMRDGGRNPFIALDGKWSEYYSTRSRKLKKANNLAANRLSRAGEVRIDWLRADDCDDSQLAAMLDRVVHVSAQSWKQATPNSLDKPGPQAFVRTLTRAAHARRWLSIWLLHVDGKPLAMEYQLIDGKNIRALRSDFDAAYEPMSPGSHLFHNLLRSSFESGLQRYYMGPGDNLYKLRWTDSGEPLHRMCVYNGTLRGRLAWARDAIAKPAARRLRSRWQRAAEASPTDALTPDLRNVTSDTEASAAGSSKAVQKELA